MSTPVRQTPHTIVIGLGTEMRGDDGFGAAVIELLRDQPGLGGRAQLARCDGEPARMIDLWDGYTNALVVDAVHGGAERFGFLYRQEVVTRAANGQSAREAGRAPGTEPRGNGHALGLGAAVQLGRVLDRLPGRLIVYAVHGGDFRLGAPLSHPVALAVPELATRIAREVLGLLSPGVPRDESAAARRPSAPGRVLSPHATLGK